jgi:hypothetical protein
VSNFYGPYSYSRIATYSQCPLKFKFSYIDMVQVDSLPSPAMERGTEIHKTIEDYILGETEQLHPDIHKTYGQFFMGLRANFECFPEEKMGATREFEPCDYDDPDVYIRGIIDLRIRPKPEINDIPTVYDHKTGKIYQDHVAQRAFYGILALINVPDIEHIRVTNIYVDLVKIASTDYYRGMLGDMIALLVKDKIEMIERDEYFPANPSFSCRWCKFSKHNGGPCSF